MPALTNKTIEKLKYDLVREGLVDLDDLTLAQETAQKNNTNLALELIKTNHITEKRILGFIENKLHIPYVELNDYTPDVDCLQYITAEKAQKHNIFPLFKIKDVLTIAMSDPLDLFTINNLFENNNLSVEPVVCSELSIKKAIGEYYSGSENQKQTNWQDKLILADITDENLRNTTIEIIEDAIINEYKNIYMEHSFSGLNLFFDRELKGFIPALIVPRFLFELKMITGLDTEITDIVQNSKFRFEFNGNDYNIITSIFPTQYGERISLSINQSFQNIEKNFIQNNLDKILEKPSLIAIKNSSKDNLVSFVYSLAEFLSDKYSVLLVENISQYELPHVVQMEFNENTAIHFDKILQNIELQNFDIIFWEKTYTKEQAKKLKLLSKERTIITVPYSVDMDLFDFVITPEM